MRHNQTGEELVNQPNTIEAGEAAEDESHYLPPRSSVHPSEQTKVTRTFYQILLLLFLLLVVGLGWWGIEYTSKP
ncbi:MULTISPECIES: hypothetical protein [Paenibacillus]|uniref:Uncharacterized protein n=1 Tax=Paenibacillus lutrae TaxID=2078573 RepID=A0A7X3FHV6_9BACL|nr:MULTISPECIES: hypothetical protein [Paenibacillus]MVP00074.1 hypothetical protein [Paenibacillus lutrae]